MPIEGRRPFTEMFEVAQTELVREASSDQEAKYRGKINQVYMDDLPSVLPEKYLRMRGYITAKADYTTGTVTVGSGTSNIVGASTSWTSANSDDFNIKIAGRNRIYRATFDAGTSLTFQNSLTWVEASGTGLTYKLVQNRYSLASDFNYMATDNKNDPNVVSYYQNGQELFLTPESNESYDRIYNDQVSTGLDKYTVRYASSGTKYLEVWPNLDEADILGYWYIPVLSEMIEYTTGTCTFTTGTAVTGSSTSWGSLSTANTYYMRNDADGTGSASKWAKISSIGGATSLTLSSVYSFTSGTGISYTISQVSRLQGRFDSGMIYKTAMILDPDNVMVPKWQALYQEAVGMDRTVEQRRTTTKTLKGFPGLR